jgi:hypothetical protein
MKKIASLVFCTLLVIVVNAQQEAQSMHHDDKDITGLIIYPNPSADVVYIEHICPVTEVMVFNILGMVVDRFETNRSLHYVLDLSELRHGMYFIRVTDEESSIYIQKVIKK